jgi:hypothetical protein
MSSYLDAIAVLRVEGSLVEYNIADYVRVNKATQWILDALTVEADPDKNIDATSVVVLTTPGGELVDVLVNDVSIGYFACRLICLTLAKPDAFTDGQGTAIFPRMMKQAELIASGLASEIDVEELLRKHGCYVAPLFGETA